MPQLNPAPWFTTLCTSWTIFLLMVGLMIKMVPLTTPMKHTNTHKTNSWPWP